MFINDLPSVLLHCTSHLYADDMQIYLSCKPAKLNESIEFINSDLQRIIEWTESNGLNLNVDKTQAMLIRWKKTNFETISLSLNNTTINFSNSIVNLGVTMNSTFNWIDHCNKVASKVYASLRSLWPHQYLMSTKTRILLVKSLVMPHFCYGDVIASKKCCRSERILQQAFNSCIRFAFNLKRFDHVMRFQDKILDTTLMNYLLMRQLLFLYKLIRIKKPDYIFKILKSFNSTRIHHYVIPNHKFNNMHTSFFVYAISKWNELPETVKLSRCSNDFKLSILKLH